MVTTVTQEQQADEEEKVERLPPPPPSPASSWQERMVALQAQQQTFQAVNAQHQQQLAQYQATLVEQNLHAILNGHSPELS